MLWNNPTLIPLVATIAGLVFIPGAIVLIVWLLIRHAGNRRTEQHRERMAMIEKGLLTPEMMGDETRGMMNGLPAPERRLMKGITFASIGMAVTLWFLFMGEGGGTILGLIPLFLGLSWIAFYVVGRLFPSHEADKFDQTEAESRESEDQRQVEREASGPSVNH